MYKNHNHYQNEYIIKDNKFTEKLNLSFDSIDISNKNIIEKSPINKNNNNNNNNNINNKTFSINDLNNFIGADRKIIINDTYEFWVHDEALINQSNHFYEYLKGDKKSQIKEEKIKFEELNKNITRKKSIKNLKRKLSKNLNTITNISNIDNIDINSNREKEKEKEKEINGKKLDTIENNNNTLLTVDNDDYNKIININNNNEKHDKYIIKSYFYFPHCEIFFDILTWIYTLDAERLSNSIDDPESFLTILNLGIFLEMKDNFFNDLLFNVKNKVELKINEKLFNHNLWSRFSFSFIILKSLLNIFIEEENYFLRIIACFYWLKEDNTLKQNLLDKENEIKERDIELFTSRDFSQVKIFIKNEKYLEKLKINEIKTLKEKFSKLISGLDCRNLIEKYLEKTDLRINCIICNRVNFF
jgi:hypothetical protein